MVNIDKPIKIECTPNAQKWLIDAISSSCIGEFSTEERCRNYSFCNDCLKDNIVWVIKEGDN